MNRWFSKITAGFFCFYCLAIATDVFGIGPDYPHNEVTNTSCSSCHLYTLDPPAWYDSDNPFDNLCESCHNDIFLPDFTVLTHSSNNTSTRYGDWSINCRTCHYPHYQMQYRVYDEDSFVFSGTSTTIEGGNLTMSDAGWEEDQFNDYILVPNIDWVEYNFRIIDTANDTLVVDGQIDPAKANDGDSFAIIYGKLINWEITTPNSGDKAVRFFDQNGTNSFADGDSTYDGVCEVCHTRTTHFRNDGSGSDQLHNNVGGPAGDKCTACHKHEFGFSHNEDLSCDTCHGVDSGQGTTQSHSTHTEDDADDLHGPNVNCSTCHDTDNFPNFKSGTDSNGDGYYNLEETDVCDNCHSPGGMVDGVNDPDVGVKNNWSGSIYDGDSLKAGKEMWCISCHDEDPANSKQDGSGISAPNKAGDGLTWGYYETGHGVTGSYNATLHGQNGPGYSCLICHDKSVSHISHISGDATRLQAVADDGLEYTSEISEVCLDCHKIEQSSNGTLGYDATAEATVHSGGFLGDYNDGANASEAFPAYGDSANYGANPGYQCVDCHDVHGTRKLAMVLDTIDGNIGGMSNPVAISGFEANSTDLSGLDPSSSANDGVCDACHASGSTPHPDTSYPGNHNYGRNCITCHWHYNSFAHGKICSECHGHDAGSEYDPDMSLPFSAAVDSSSQGVGTSWSHSTHTETDSDDLIGPAIYCDTCHDVNNMPRFRNQDDSGNHTLAETNICDNCHSPGGSYDGVNDAEIGAKANWSTGIYELDANGSRTLKSGREKWCATCHDEEASNSEVDGSGVFAPNIVGDEDNETYVYGTGWGFYKTGHGLSANETLPASGGVKDGPGKGCADCHDLSTAHIDGIERTFDCTSGTGGACSADYQAGYRLKDISGELPMEIPPAGRTLASFRLCFSCHTNTDDWLSGDSYYRDKTNFYDSGDDGNYHIYHLSYSQSSELDWDGSFEGSMSCITCHNVHGSKNLAMIRSGELTGFSSITVRYGNGCSTHTSGQVEPVPNDITLEASTKSTMRADETGPYCSHCHGSTNIRAIVRDPAGVENSVPELDWVTSPAYDFDGVNPDSAESGTEFTFKVKYIDINQDGPPDTMQVWIDRNDDGLYVDDADPALDEKIDMESAFAEPDTCSPYSTGVDYVATTTIEKPSSGNEISYRFYADYDVDVAIGAPTAENTLTVSNKIPELAWTEEVNYEDDGVDPGYGPADGNYTFRVKYIDDDGDLCPVGDTEDIQVWIDQDLNGDYDSAEKFNLTEVSVGDTDCTTEGDGKLYYTNQILSNTSEGAVTYDYRFNATDGTDNATGIPADSGGTVTVAGTANNPPLLAWAAGTCRPEGAMPPRSATSSTIEFAVLYFDEDNQCPAGGSSDIQVYVDLDGSGNYTAGEMINLNEANGSDTDCREAGGGKLYTVEVTPSTVAEDLAYEFHATDGVDQALGEPRTEGGTFNVLSADLVVSQDGSEDFTTISDAVSNSSSGDTILVYDGNYSEYVSMGDGTYNSINLYSACGPEDTVISDSNSPVVYFYYEGGNSTLDGFTVTGSSGRGIEAVGDDYDTGDSKLIIKDCIIRDNGGRGVYGFRANVTLIDSEVYGNQGGGLELYAGSVTDSVIRDNWVDGNGGGIASCSSSDGVGVFDLTNVTITGNNATGNGGGIFCDTKQYSASWEKVTLTGNSANSTGGGAYSTYCFPTVTNSLISDNNATYNGGGLGVGSYSSLWLENTTVVNNRAINGDGGAFYSSDGPVSLANSIAWGNRAGDAGHIGYFANDGKEIKLYDSIIENNGDLDITDDNYFIAVSTSWVNDTGTNYDTDPNFENSGSNGDYHINEPSDAINNAADNSGRGIPGDDLEGNIRPAGSEDIGAYEFHNEALKVNFTSSFQLTADEMGIAVITLQLSEVSNYDVEVPFTVNDQSTALGGGIDYSITASPVTITAGNTTAEIIVTISSDELDEYNETVIVDMGTPVNASLGSKTSHTVSISDDDNTPTVSFTALEQQADENGTAVVTAQLSELSGRYVEVPFTVSGESTAAGGGTDYEITATPVTIAAGDTEADITLTIATDSLDEANETVIINMGTPTNANQGSTTSHTLTITDDDEPPTVSFASAEQNTEDENGTASITAELSAISGLEVTVPFTVNGTSTANETDYNITASPLIISPGDNSADITVTVVADEEDEEDETVIIDMENPGNATLGTITSHTLTIFDDDYAGNAPPEKPVNLTPEDNATEVGLSPVLTASVFNDPIDANDTHAASQWQISTISDFSDILYDDTGTSGDLESHTVSATLNATSTYYWHVRYQDSNGTWSRYSDGTSFTTTDTVMPDGALSYWKFDEGTGTIAYDSVGDNNATLSGATWTVSGRYDDAVSFDGTSDTVDTGEGSASSLALTGDMTIEAWISPNDLDGRTLISKGHSQEFELTFWGNKLHYYSDRPTSPFYWEAIFDTEFAANATWYHVVVVRNSAERTVKLYVNGEEDTTTGNYYSDPPESANRVYIGSRSDGSNSFSGIIDEVAIYDRMLTEEEIQLRYIASGGGITFHAPDQPVNIDPADGESGVSVTPTLSCDTYHDDDNHDHAASRWQIRKASGIFGDADSYDSDWTVTDLTSFSLDGTAWPVALSTWSYRLPLVLSRDTNSTNQRVKIVLSPADFDYSKVESTGHDFRFYLADGTALSYSRPIWNYNGTSVLFVEVPPTGVENIYMYYGNSGAGDVSDASITPNTLVDSGFEDYTDLAGGYWEVKQTNSSSPFDITLETTDGNPDHYVYIDNDGSGLFGMNYFAQHITVPEDVITSASFSADYQTYCGRSARSGMYEVLLLEETVWDNVTNGDTGFDYRTLYDGTGDEALWHEFIKTQGDNVGSWTYGETTSDLATVLNNHHGENLVAVIVWTAWHGDQVEWGKLDNFELSYDFSAEPLTAEMGVQQTYPVAGLAYGTEYFWRVQHEDDSGDRSLWSEETSFTTSPPSVGFDSSSQSQLETSGNVTISVQLSTAGDQDVSVGFSVNASSTAVGGGTDYTITASPLVIPAGENSADITVTLVDDEEEEVNNETVIVELTNSTNATLGTITSHTLSIVDDDYTGTPPDQPTNLTPADSATDVDRNPILTASAFSDGDNDTHAASQWQLSTVSDFSTIHHDSGAVDANVSHTVSATLDNNATYYWHVRYQDIRGIWSQYSAGTSFTTESTDPSASGGVAYWDFDEGNGSIAADSFSTNDGNLKESTTWAAGISDDAASFTAAGDKIEPAVVGTGLMNGHSAHTVEAWIRWAGSTDRDIIFMEGGQTHGYGLTIESSADEITYTVNSNGATDNLVAAESNIVIDEWTHIAVTYDGSAGEMKIYINGNEVASQTSGVPTSIPDPALGWRIGGTSEADVHDGSTATSTSFAGEIDELVVYNRALTVEEIEDRAALHYGSGPDQPLNLDPDGDVDISLMPTLSCDTFQDDDNDTHAFSHWQVRKASGLYGDANSTDSGWTNTDLTSYTVGKTLEYNTQYFWRVQHEDDSGDRSLWSEETGFTTITE